MVQRHPAAATVQQRRRSQGQRFVSPPLDPRAEQADADSQDLLAGDLDSRSTQRPSWLKEMNAIPNSPGANSIGGSRRKCSLRKVAAMAISAATASPLAGRAGPTGPPGDARPSRLRPVSPAAGAGGVAAGNSGTASPVGSRNGYRSSAIPSRIRLSGPPVQGAARDGGLRLPQGGAECDKPLPARVRTGSFRRRNRRFPGAALAERRVAGLPSGPARRASRPPLADPLCSVPPVPPIRPKAPRCPSRAHPPHRRAAPGQRGDHDRRQRPVRHGAGGCGWTWRAFRRSTGIGPDPRCLFDRPRPPHPREARLLVARVGHIRGFTAFAAVAAVTAPGSTCRSTSARSCGRCLPVLTVSRSPASTRSSRAV